MLPLYARHLPVNDEALDAGSVVGHDVGRPHVLAAERLLAEEVSLVQVADKLLLGRSLLLFGHFYLNKFECNNVV